MRTSSLSWIIMDNPYIYRLPMDNAWEIQRDIVGGDGNLCLKFVSNSLIFLVISGTLQGDLGELRGQSEPFLLWIQKKACTTCWHFVARSGNHRKPSLNIFGIFGESHDVARETSQMGCPDPFKIDLGQFLEDINSHHIIQELSKANPKLTRSWSHADPKLIPNSS